MPLPRVAVLNREGKQQRHARPIGIPTVKTAGAVAFNIACVSISLTISLSFLSEAAAQPHSERATNVLTRLLLGAQAAHDLNRQREGSEAVAIGLISPTNLGDGSYYGYGDYYGRGDYFTDTLSRRRD